MGRIGSLTRRALVVAGAVVVLALTTAAEAGKSSGNAASKANKRVVTEFIASWNDPDKAVMYLAHNASVRVIDDQPFVVGRDAIAAVFKSFLTPGVTISVKTLKTTVHGPVVLTSRIDTMKTPGKPD